MELRQLRYFIGVIEAGSLLGASRMLHVAQPALSQHMAALEAELGATLFVRSSRGMTPTDSGRRFAEHARIVLSDVERARQAARADPVEPEGDVLVGLPTTVALVATLPILQAVRSRFPKVTLRLVESHSGFLKEWLQTGRLDVSVLFGAAPETWLTQRPVLREELGFVFPPGLHAGGPKGLVFSRLADFALLLPGKDHGLRRILDEACALHGVRMNVVAEIDSLPNIKKAVEQGIACTVLSPAAVADEVRQGRLGCAQLRSPAISRTIVCATSLSRPLSPAASAVAGLVYEQLRALVTGGHWPGSLED